MTASITRSSIEFSTRCTRLMGLLLEARGAGARLARISEVDALVDRGQAGFFLKHDVHGMSLARLLEFARLEAENHIHGAYLFMAPDHPLTKSHYSFAQQAQAMRSIRDLGHEIGVHVDPYFLMESLRQPLANIMRLVMDRFAAEGIPVRLGNMHGNSKFKMPDNHGFGTMFDLFEELGRQPDYPTLANVPPATADLIRAHRMSLRSLGITHWGDMPIWSARHGFVVTNFITDNQLAKRGTLEFLASADTIGQYKLAERQPPGSRSPSRARQYVKCASTAEHDLKPESQHVPFDDLACERQFRRYAAHPTLILIHPEHFC